MYPRMSTFTLSRTGECGWLVSRWRSIGYQVHAKNPNMKVSMQGAVKSLARPGRKQANVSVGMAWISFGALLCWKKKLDDSSRLDVVEIARVPDMLPSLFPSRSGYGLISTVVYLLNKPNCSEMSNEWSHVCSLQETGVSRRSTVGESRLIWGGFLIWGGALFHTRRCCTLCLRM